MENQNNREYRENSRRAQRMRNEKRRKKRARNRILAAAGSTLLLLAAGIFVYVNVLGNREQDSSNGDNATINIYDQIRDNKDEDIFGETDLNLEDLKELIVQAEDMEQNSYEQASAEKLKQRIEEAKSTVESQGTEIDTNTIGIAYMNLVIAMNALTPAQ